MAVNLFCYDCNLPIAGGKKLCGNCGLPALVGAGSVLDSGSDEYTIDRVLGEGGMGVAYVALNQAGDEVVVKQLFEDSDPAIHAENLMRFEREARIQKSISHPRFPAGYGYFTEAGIHFMAMELVPGDNVDQLLTSRGKFSEQQSLEIGIQICEGALELHNHTAPTGIPDRIIHRDIKPNNLILKANGEIVILDLGIARPETQSAATQNRMTGSLGTTVYMAKEQLLQNPVVASDQYSIAATMFHLVLGYTLPEPYPARPAAIDQLPPSWQPKCRRALDDDHTLRFPSVKEFQTELVRLLPATLQARYAALLPQTTVATTATPLPVSIRFVSSPTSMINPGEYRQAIAGQLRLGNQGYVSARIAPFIIDLGAGARNGTPVVADQFGNFTLGIADITVPVSVGRRTIEIVIQDPMTATEVHRETVIIDKPWSAGATQFGAGVSHAASSALRGLGTPFRAVGLWWHNRQLAKAPLFQAKAAAYLAKKQFKAQKYSAKQAWKLGKKQTKAAVKAAARTASAAAGGTSQPAAWWANLVTIVVVVAVFILANWFGNTSWAPKIWPTLGVLVFCAMVYRIRPRKQFELKPWLRRTVWNPLTLVWLLGLLGWYLR